VENGGEVRPLFSYGVGIDTHKDFIEVCVLLKQGDAIRQYEQTSSTAWDSLVKANQWIKETIESKTIPTVTPEPLRYTIESTSTYHLPVIKAFDGKPSVVNPILAGATRRKTDKLDARLLAYQSMTGLWPESFIAPSKIQTLRLLMKQREYHQRTCTAISNRINNYILRFGHTIGSMGSVRNSVNRSIIEEMCEDGYEYSESVKIIENGKFVCPEGLPEEVKIIIKKMYEEFDMHNAEIQKYQKQALEYAKKLEWETDKGYVKGDVLIKNLLTIPSVGELMALVWLTEVVTPMRFEMPQKLSAYCGCDPSLKVSAGKVTSQTRRLGNAKLHHHLTMIAGTCVNRHSEPFGQWGYALYKKHTKGGYKKASGAVARRIAVALYFVHKRNEPFSYEKYNFYKQEVPDYSIEKMGFTKRLHNALVANSLLTSKAITESYLTGDIHKLKGIGKKAAGEINVWIQNNKIMHRKAIWY
jgi:transposase